MQTYFKHGMGDSLTLYFEIFRNNIGQTGESPTVAIQKKSTGEWLNDAKDAWQAGYNDVPMSEADDINLPGIYTLDITHIDETTETYNCYFKNTGENTGYDFESHQFTGAVYVPDTSGYAEGTVLGNLDQIKNKDGARTFDQATDSLEGISDHGLSTTNLGDIADAVWDEPHAEHVDPASTGYQLSAGGELSGNNLVTITVQDQLTSNPIPDVSIAVYDNAMTFIIGILTSDSLGQAVFALDDGAYKVVPRKAGVTFDVPLDLTVSGATQQTYQGTEFIQSLPASPETCIVYGYAVDLSGQVVEGAIIEAKNEETSLFVATNKLVEFKAHATSDATGYWQLELIRNSQLSDPTKQYRIIITSDSRKSYSKSVIIPDATSAEFSAL